jgi:hypothetical protein
MTAQAARPDAWPEHSSPNDLAEYAFFSSVNDHVLDQVNHEQIAAVIQVARVADVNLAAGAPRRRLGGHIQ